MFIITLTMNEQDKGKLLSIYEKYRNYIYVIAYEVLQNPAKTEDAVSESILKIAKSLDKIKDIGSSKSKAYIGIIAKNTALDIYRKNKNRNIKFDESYMGLLPDISEEFELKDDYRRAVEAINKLPDKYRDVLILRYVNELSDEEIAKTLGIKKDNVRKRAERGRKRIVFALGELSDIDE
ncbi:MAG: RNA polymerase sigma factor [Tissierellia bacterium]|nr:RNA polymerase sigma factor [Tissierellia bacterium]